MRAPSEARADSGRIPRHAATIGQRIGSAIEWCAIIAICTIVGLAGALTLIGAFGNSSGGIIQ